jgi:hypothetical protein
MANSATHHDSHDTAPERLELGSFAGSIFWPALFIGAGLLVVALILGFMKGPAAFFFAYLAGYCFVLSLAVGALFFVLLQYLTKAGWSVNIRRIAEWMASAMPILGLLALPILYAVLVQHNGVPYRWSDPSWGKSTETVQLKVEGALKPEGISASKRAYLSPPWFSLRIVIYFVIWSSIALYYARQSALQDTTGDPKITARLQSLSAPALVVTALTVTLAAFDLMMSLDPTWSSTMFGVYYFAGSMLAFYAFTIITVILLQSRGYLTKGITVEHIHDLGKYLFAFVFFFGYIAFSQYMLMWYANIPEETEWFLRRGVSTEPGQQTGFTPFAFMLLFGKVLIPFAGLLSRHVKRNPKTLIFWAVWLLVFHWADLFWVITPEMFGQTSASLSEVLGTLPLEIAAALGLLGIFVATVVRKASHESLRPLHDPRMNEALAFHNI